MKIPKVSKVKYRSVKRFKVGPLRRLERSMQFYCYNCIPSFLCGSRPLCRCCWFKCCKSVKE
jgi:hypothetical protein